MDFSQEAHCNQCRNACPITNLSCKKGRTFYGLPDASTIEIKESLVQKLIRTGKRCDALNNDLLGWGIEEGMLLNALNGQQQAQLYEILDILENRWKTDFGGV